MRTYIITIAQPGGAVRLFEISSNCFRAAVEAAQARLHAGESILRLTVVYQTHFALENSNN